MRARFLALLAAAIIVLAGIPAAGLVAASAQQADHVSSEQPSSSRTARAAQSSGPATLAGPSAALAGRVGFRYDFPVTNKRTASLQMRRPGQTQWMDVDTAALKNTGSRVRGSFLFKKFSADSEFRAYAAPVTVARKRYPALTSNTILVRLTTLTIGINEPAANSDLVVTAKLQPPVPGTMLDVTFGLPNGKLGTDLSTSIQTDQLSADFASDGRAVVRQPTPSGGPAGVYAKVVDADGTYLGGQSFNTFIEPPAPETARPSEFIREPDSRASIGFSPSGEWSIEGIDRDGVIVLRRNGAEFSRFDVGQMCSMPAAFGDKLDRERAPYKASIDNGGKTIAFGLFDSDYFAPWNLFAVDTAANKCHFIGRSTFYQSRPWISPRVSSEGRYVTAIPSSREPQGTLRNTIFDMATGSDLSTPLGSLFREPERYPASLTTNASSFVQPIFTQYDNEFGGRTATLVDRASGEQTVLWQRGGKEVETNAEGNVVVGIKDNHFVMGDLTSGTLTHLANMDADTYTGSIVRISPNGRFAMAQWHRRVVAVDLESGRVRELDLNPTDTDYFDHLDDNYADTRTNVAIGDDGTVRWSFAFWDAF